ncbi:tetratricopeptide-like helical domain, DYW domain protein [Tanacetum coccineum]
MDKSWINAPITSKIFRDGAKNFISFARVRSIRGLIKCPCNKCCLGKWLDVESAHGDILRHGFLPGYTKWTVHGEHTISLPPYQSTNVNVEKTFFGQEDIRGLVRDALGINSLPSDNTQLGDTTMEGDTNKYVENGDHGDEGVSYKKLLEECDKELYAKLLRDAFSHLTALPSFSNEAKKFTKDLGLGEKAHGNDIGVYLKPLIKELQLLWKGVDAYDAFSKQHFKLKLPLWELETCKKQLATHNKKVESYRKQVETQSLQMKNMEQKLDGVYAMLKLLPAFPDLDNVASTSAAGTCDKQELDEDERSKKISMEFLSRLIDDFCKLGLYQ